MMFFAVLLIKSKTIQLLCINKNRYTLLYKLFGLSSEFFFDCILYGKNLSFNNKFGLYG